MFFPAPPPTSQDSDDEVYSSIDNRPLPAFPPVEVDYEDAYILRVDSVPQRDVLPGIAIGEYQYNYQYRLIVCTYYAKVYSRSPGPGSMANTDLLYSLYRDSYDILTG